MVIEHVVAGPACSPLRLTQEALSAALTARAHGFPVDVAVLASFAEFLRPIVGGMPVGSVALNVGPDGSILARIVCAGPSTIIEILCDPDVPTLDLLVDGDGATAGEWEGLVPDEVTRRLAHRFVA